MRSIFDPFDSWVSRQPERLLFSFIGLDGEEKESYSYSEFDARVRTVAARLLGHSFIKWGDRVLLAYPPGLEAIVAFFACAHIGVIPVPVPLPSRSGRTGELDRLRSVAENSQATAIASTEAEIVRMPALAAATLVGDLAKPVRWVATDSNHNFLHIRRTPHPILFLQYTSGATSDPRGVIVRHDSVLSNAGGTVGLEEIGVTWLPQHHDMGLIGYYLFAAITGATTYGMSPGDFMRRPGLWLQTISRVRATYSSAPNFAFEYCCQDGKIADADLRGVDLGSLRVLMSAAEPVDPRVSSRFRERFGQYGLSTDAQVVAYGLAENTLSVTQNGRRVLRVNREALQWGAVIDAHGDDSSGSGIGTVASCGSPIDGTTVAIVDPETCEPLRDRQVGEVWVTGTSVCGGYWMQTELTRDVFEARILSVPSDSRRYLRTGDLGFSDNGEIFVCGRRKEVIVCRGSKYFPQDIELVAEEASPLLRRRGVVALSGQGSKDELIVLVEARDGPGSPDLAEIARAIQTRCNIRAQRIMRVPPGSIVRTTSGKTARCATGALWRNGQLACLEEYVVQDPLAHGREARCSLSDIITTLRGLDPRAEREIPLSELGVDSLALVELVVGLEQVLEERNCHGLARAIDATVLQRMTVSQLVRLLEHLEVDSHEGAVAWKRVLDESRAAVTAQDDARMRQDAVLELGATLPQVNDGRRIERALITGATGFLGAFLLPCLLDQTTWTFDVLVRARDAAGARLRLEGALREAGIWSMSLATAIAQRVNIVCGDLAQDGLGLSAATRDLLTSQVDAVIHNGALVNYVLNYDILRLHNVEGTRRLLALACEGKPKVFHYISSTFIFGWTQQPLLSETDSNEEMRDLDFGYSQSKWVAERLVRSASSLGADARIYRPSLLSASTRGVADRNDVALRLLAFMVKYGIAVESANQVSLIPVDIAATNMAAIISSESEGTGAYHVTADEYYTMAHITRVIEQEHGKCFVYLGIPEFLKALNALASRDDPVYPLLDFFNRSARRIEAMQLKRYSNARYRIARDSKHYAVPDPPLRETVSYLVLAMRRLGWFGDGTACSEDLARPLDRDNVAI